MKLSVLLREYVYHGKDGDKFTCLVAQVKRDVDTNLVYKNRSNNYRNNTIEKNENQPRKKNWNESYVNDVYIKCTSVHVNRSIE